MSRLQQLRVEWKPRIPDMLQNLRSVTFERGQATSCVADEEKVQGRFPHTFGRPVVTGKKGDAGDRRPLKVGIALSGGQASGGHNVIAGLFDALKALDPASQLDGFLGGPNGIVACHVIELTDEKIAPFRNQGGFDLIGSGRDKIETEDQLLGALKTVQQMQLDGLVIVGGDDSNTNAAVLAEFFLQKGCQTAVIGVPKTIDGDLKNAYLEIPFGFDTATKTFSEIIGNIAKDAVSAKKYTHFIRLMGRSASHITLECALATHPNVALIGEEIARDGVTLKQIAKEVADVVEKRSEQGKDYGVVLVPEGLIEFIPEMGCLISELNRLAAAGGGTEGLSDGGKASYDALPLAIQEQLLLDRDPHGNVQVSRIETEKLLIGSVQAELAQRPFKGKFAPQSHFYGYEGRAGLPSNFDAQYCYALGHTAALLVKEGLTGYMACVGNLSRPLSQWNVIGLPLSMLMHMEIRKGEEKPVIRKALVDLEGKPFAFFAENRKGWALEDHYRCPGPIQFFGDAELIDAVPMTLQF